MSTPIKELLIEAAEALENLTNFADQVKWNDLVKRLRAAAMENAPRLTPSVTDKTVSHVKSGSRHQSQGR